VQWVPSSDRAADVTAALLREGDLVLVKGSRGTRVDVIADRVAAVFG
jgi:UDP-N-acetylmuramyl pentapeptide synthase